MTSQNKNQDAKKTPTPSPQRAQRRPKDPRLFLPPMGRGLRFFAVALFAAAAASVIWFIVANPLDLAWRGGPEGESRPAQTAITEAAETLYQCPMHPEALRSEPGDCPICGMPLVEVGQMQQGDHEAGPALYIEPAQIQNMGVVSVAAHVGPLKRSLRTVGILDFNADSVSWVNTKYSGWIEKVHVSYVGQEVTAGQPLFEIYSPDLVTTQEEFLRAVDYAAAMDDSGRPLVRQQALDLLASTRARLEYWDISAAQIEALQQRQQVERRLVVPSPASGVVVDVMKESLEGMYVTPGMNLYRIADLNSIWVHADVFESDLPWIRKGQPAEVTLAAGVDRTLHGEILFLYPKVSEDTRTLKICVQVPNPDQRLRPGMFADVTLRGPDQAEGLLIPDAAVLRSGRRDLVFVDEGEGHFSPRQVRLGQRSGDTLIQVLEGLSEGERVVTQAQFMLDSESRLQEAINRYVRRRQPGGEGGEQP